MKSHGRKPRANQHPFKSLGILLLPGGKRGEGRRFICFPVLRSMLACFFLLTTTNRKLEKAILGGAEGAMYSRRGVCLLTTDIPLGALNKAA